MTQEDKELLLKDLCARLLYAPKGIYSLKCDSMHPITFDHLTTRYIDRFMNEQPSYTDEIVDIKLYLRPMSSMTEEEKKEYAKFFRAFSCSMYERESVERIDWLNSHHFDYRGLIEKGLALPITKEEENEEISTI